MRLLSAAGQPRQPDPRDGPDAPALTSDDLATVYCVHLDVRTGIAVDITPLDGTAGSGLANELHTVDELLDPPL